jgi:hypothetical protein
MEMHGMARLTAARTMHNALSVARLAVTPRPGPLTATLLAEGLAGRGQAPLASFDFRAVEPPLVGQPMAICGKATGPATCDLRVETPAGRPAMTARATLAEPR